MNLYFRLLWLLLRSRFVKRIGVLDESRLKFRVWPHDCDVNFHLTNARYFSLCDLSRIYYMSQVGVLYKMFRRKWFPVIQAQEISYFRPINPMQCVEIVTRFAWWDEKYWYAEHELLCGDNVCATVQVRGAILHGKKVIPMHEVLTLVDEEVDVPDKSVQIEHWQKLIEAKKEVKISQVDDY